MFLIIELPEEKYIAAKNGEWLDCDNQAIICGVAEGIPLDKLQADVEYIKRQDAISEIREMAKWHTGDAFNADRVIQHLKQLPSVAIPPAEPTRVLYIGDGYYNGEMVYDMAECPSCGEKYEDDEPAWKYAKFCMKCGQAISWEMEWEAEGEEE